MRLALPPSSCRVYTPPDLAAAIVQALPHNPKSSWLEPSHGTGVFVNAISQMGVKRDRIVAVDLDPCASSADTLATTIRGVDFLRWASTTNQRFDCIVGNPPFVAIRRLPISLRRTAEMTLDLDGTAIGRSANTWYAFVLASLRLLKKGGALAFVLPSAAEFTNYSSAIRTAVHLTFGRLELYRCKRPLFETVQEGTLVAIARNFGEQPCQVVRRRFESREALIQALMQSGQLRGRLCRVKNVKASPIMLPLKLIANIRLGGVTGDASYFLMADQKRKHLALPTSALTPVVSKAKHLRFAYLERDHWNELKKNDERVWLFNPTPSLVRRESSVKQYLYPKEGGCNRDAYKIAGRKPWYRTPLLSKADAFMSGMSQQGPWICLNEFPRLRATNTLYVLNFLARQREDRYMWALSMLTSIVQRQIRGIGRHYADGLVKYEPGSLGELELPRLKPNSNHRLLYQQAVTALLNSDLATAKDIADSVRM